MKFPHYSTSINPSTWRLTPSSFRRITETPWGIVIAPYVCPPSWLLLVSAASVNKPCSLLSHCVFAPGTNLVTGFAEPGHMVFTLEMRPHLKVLSSLALHMACFLLYN